jgi:hypothetical protein
MPFARSLSAVRLVISGKLSKLVSEGTVYYLLPE